MGARPGGRHPEPAGPCGASGDRLFGGAGPAGGRPRDRPDRLVVVRCAQPQGGVGHRLGRRRAEAAGATAVMRRTGRPPELDWHALPAGAPVPPVAAALHTLQALRAQDLEPDPVEGGSRIRQGVAKDRQISITDPEMRHGRKSSATPVDGYKRHIAHDLDEQVILAAEVLPANTPDTAGLEPLLIAVELQHRQVTSLHIDRGDLGDDLIPTYQAAGAAILCWPGRPPTRPGSSASGNFNSIWPPVRRPVRPAK